MLRLAARPASRFRSIKNSMQTFGRSFRGSRISAAKDMQFGIEEKSFKVGHSFSESVGRSFNESRSSDALNIPFGIEEKPYKVGRSFNESGSFVTQEIPLGIKEKPFKAACCFSESESSVAQDIPFGIEEKLFKDYEFIRANKNPACDVIDDNSEDERVFKYAPVLRRALFNDGFAALALGVRGKGLRTGIQLAKKAIFYHCKRIARKINSSTEIVQIATIVGGRRIGELMALATEKVGKDGLFLMSQVKNTMADELEFTNGMELRWTSESRLIPYFCTNKTKRSSGFENPLILIHEDTVSNKNVVMQAIRKSINTRRPLLIAAEGVTSDVITFLKRKRKFLGAQVCVIVPRYGVENSKSIMQDLAIFTRSQVVTDVSDVNSILLMLGSCKEARITSFSTIIIGGSGSQENIEERCEQLRSTIKMSTSCSDETKSLEHRLVNLSRGAVIIKVGASVAEESQIRRRLGNAILAIEYAISEGIVPGGGVAFLHSLKELDKLEVKNHSQKLGVKLMQHVIKMPVYSIASTAGFDGLAVVQKLLEQDNPYLGFNPATGEYVDMIKSGNIDPFWLIINELGQVVSDFNGDSFVWSYINERKTGEIGDSCDSYFALE